MELNLNFQEILTAFMVLFAVLKLQALFQLSSILTVQIKNTIRQSSRHINIYNLYFYLQAKLCSKYLRPTIATLAIAGSLIIYALTVETTFNIKLFRSD